jgi:hypothetical protein
MSNPAPKPDDDLGPWSDPHACREEFRRRLAERGILVRMPKMDNHWEDPPALPISADEASAMVVRMRQESEH